MLRNYLTVSLRNLTRQKGHALINVIGLAIGMACCILLGIYVQNELSYDAWHQNGDRIYRVLRESRAEGNTVMSAGSSGPLAEALRNDFPEIETTVRRMSWGGIWVERGEKGFYQRFAWADPNFFSVFDFPLIEGAPETALADPHTIVITQSMAEKYFPNENPMGQTISVDDRYFGGDFRITGIAKDVPSNSQFTFDFVSSSMHQTFPERYWHFWRTTTRYRPIITYVLLREGVDAAELEAKLPGFIERNMGPEIHDTDTMFLQPFNRVYLHSTEDYGTIWSQVDWDYPWHSDIRYIQILGATGLFIMLLACVNFTNLATARASTRQQEVGLRKVAGAQQVQLISQFLGESLILAIIAAGIACLFAKLGLNSFNALTGKSLELSYFADPFLPGAVFIFAIVTGSLAGLYPALFMSRFQPALVLKGKSSNVGGSGLRKGLVVFQFGITAALIVSTLVVRDQLDYIRSKDLGYDRAHVLTVPLFATDRTLVYDYRAIKNEFLRHPQVLKAAVSLQQIHSVSASNTLQTGLPGKPRDNAIASLSICEGWLDTYGIPVIQGRTFSEEVASDSTDAIMLNESAVAALGIEHPIGQTVHLGERWSATVIGVVKDFNFRPLTDTVAPLILSMWVQKWSHLSLKVRTDNLPETLSFLEKTWQRYIPIRPFEYHWVDDRVASNYVQETQMRSVAAVFSGLAIAVACLGLFGLASFTAARRTKEIGIRKTLGASSTGLAGLLSSEFAKLVLLANLIVWVPCYYALNEWLNGYAYRIDIGPGPFLLTALIGMFVALVTVGSHAIRAAQADPSEVLRSE
jgi:putative ABC transport system permease protein